MFAFAVRQFIDVAHGQLVTEVWRRGSSFSRYVMGVLDVALVDVAICRSERLRERVSSQNVETLREAMLNGRLQSVVEHAQSRNVQRQDRIQARPGGKIRPSLVKNGKATWAHGTCVVEVRVERDKRLVQV